eukprot:UN12312
MEGSTQCTKLFAAKWGFFPLCHPGSAQAFFPPLTSPQTYTILVSVTTKLY